MYEYFEIVFVDFGYGWNGIFLGFVWCLVGGIGD